MFLIGFGMLLGGGLFRFVNNGNCFMVEDVLFDFWFFLRVVRICFVCVVILCGNLVSCVICIL